MHRESHLPSERGTRRQLNQQIFKQNKKLLKLTQRQSRREEVTHTNNARCHKHSFSIILSLVFIPGLN